MKYANILVPYDRSESAKHALATALEIAANRSDSCVTVFFASPVPEFESAQFLAAENMSGVMRIPPDELAAMQKEYVDYERGLLVDDLKDFVGEDILASDDAFKVAVGQGKPSKAILDYAQRNEVDLIVMGCRGLNAVAGMLGSVSYAVLRNASCPVLVEK
ncbi:MAG: universal stress protein [Slackia sp.]|nr:universal stress protein [Slackia sp.]